MWLMHRHQIACGSWNYAEDCSDENAEFEEFSDGNQLK
ncbi:hypothetical protein C4J88_3468 [Pseudomonas sp. R4-39-08]|nr:hypothetical protein C4J88_3468 [Pseudomonas sp. R4-39-08]